MYIGDYFDITINTSYTANEIVSCVLAGFDMYLNACDRKFEDHHAVIVPKNYVNQTNKMNQEPTVEGGFVGSYMWTTVLPIYKDALQSVFGEHLLVRKTLLTNATNNNISSSWRWFDAYISLLSEVQLCGNRLIGSSFYLKLRI